MIDYHVDSKVPYYSGVLILVFLVKVFAKISTQKIK